MERRNSSTETLTSIAKEFELPYYKTNKVSNMLYKNIPFSRIAEKLEVPLDFIQRIYDYHGLGVKSMKDPALQNNSRYVHSEVPFSSYASETYTVDQLFGQESEILFNLKHKWEVKCYQKISK